MPADRAPPAGRDVVVPWIVGACFLLALAIVLALSNRGFNLLDETFYVQWIGAPERYQFSIQPFGLFFHPFYDLLQQSIIALRILGACMLAGSGAILGWTIARYCRLVLKLDAGTTTFALLGALFQLTYYVLWIPTPSYNLLANVSGAMVFAGGLGWLITEPAGPERRRADRWYSALVGLGGCYAFFGKPTFAAIAAIAVALLLARDAVAGRWTLAFERAAIVALSCLLPLVLHIVYVMPIPAFIATIEGGMSALNYGNSLADLPGKTFAELRAAPRLLHVAALAAAAAAVWPVMQPTVRSRAAEIAALLLVAATVGFMGYAIVSVVTVGRLYWDAFGPELVALVLAQITLGLVRHTSGPLDWRAVGLLLFLTALPFAVAFGTANPLVRQTSISMFGALFASAVAAQMFLGNGWRRALHCGLAGLALAAVIGAVLKPYRIPQPPLFQSEPLAIPGFRGTLLVDPETKRFASEMRAVGRRAGLRPDIPVLDLSGGGPGTALFLGGRPPGNPWLIQFMDNAVPMADAFWNTLDPAERARAWIVGPIHPKFAASQVAGQIRRESARYACVGQSRMTYWEKPMPVSAWKPVGATAAQGAVLSCAGARLTGPPPS